MKWKQISMRTLFLGFLGVLLFGMYVLRLMQLQVVEGASLEAQRYATWNTTQIIPAARGEILDRNGKPMAVNAVGRDVVMDKAYLPTNQINDTLKRLIAVMERSGEQWIDNLPIAKTAPYTYLDGDAYAQPIQALISTLELQSYATAQDCLDRLRELYDLENEEPESFRKIAGVRYEMTRRGFSTANRYTFATNIKTETVPKIMERSYELPGVEVVESAIRRYVSGDIAPHLIGSVGPMYADQWNNAEDYIYNQQDGTSQAVINGRSYAMTDTIGKSGVELAFESYLKGTDGKRTVVQSGTKVVEVVEEQPQTPGSTVVLTIDSRLQKTAQDALAGQIIRMQNDPVAYPPGKGHEADAGAVVAVHVPTGEVLAAATYPSYDLSTYNNDYASLANPPEGEPSRLINRALHGVYTPGSIFKPVVALAGLTEGVVNRDSLVNCQQVYDVLGWPRYCLSAHGPVNVVNALRVSCNIYFYDVGRRLGIDKIGEYARLLGLGEPTGIELPESVGRMSSRELKEQLRGEAWQEGDTVQASIGQLDTALTPMSLASYCATLANDGTRLKSTFLKSVHSYNFEEVIYEHEPEILEQIDSPAAFAAIREGMVAASRIGTASGYFAEGLYDMTVASKTGTPETALLPNSTFIAYAPADDPQIAVAVVIEKGWHGYTGAPVARAIFDAYFTATKEAAPAQINTLLP